MQLHHHLLGNDQYGLNAGSVKKKLKVTFCDEDFDSL